MSRQCSDQTVTPTPKAQGRYGRKGTKGTKQVLILTLRIVTSPAETKLVLKE